MWFAFGGLIGIGIISWLAGGWIPLVNSIFIVAILLGAVALGHGAVVHGFMMPAAVGALGLGVMTGALTMDHGLQESVYTLIGVGILALGHDLNHRAGR